MFIFSKPGLRLLAYDWHMVRVLDFFIKYEQIQVQKS